MNFNKHSHLEGRHAFLSASKYHWVNYSVEKLENSYFNHLAVANGTRIHEFAADAIEQGIKLPRTKKTLNLFVNDAIGHKMTPEQVLYYSDNCFGTADAISFRKNILRISDLKTGVTKTSFKQLQIYAALFCLEYEVKPTDIETILSIYQNDEVRVEEGNPEEILYIMDKIIEGDRVINKIKIGG